MPSSSSKGSDLFLQTLIQRGVCHIFGNQHHRIRVVDRIASYPEIEYIITLHEASRLALRTVLRRQRAARRSSHLHVAPGPGQWTGDAVQCLGGRVRRSS